MINRSPSKDRNETHVTQVLFSSQGFQNDIQASWGGHMRFFHDQSPDCLGPRPSRGSGMLPCHHVLACSILLLLCLPGMYPLTPSLASSHSVFKEKVILAQTCMPSCSGAPTGLAGTTGISPVGLTRCTPCHCHVAAYSCWVSFLKAGHPAGSGSQHVLSTLW